MIYLEKLAQLYYYLSITGVTVLATLIALSIIYWVSTRIISPWRRGECIIHEKGELVSTFSVGSGGRYKCSKCGKETIFQD